MHLRTVALLALTAIFVCLKTPSNEGRTITALLLCVVASALAVALVYAEIAQSHSIWRWAIGEL